MLEILEYEKVSSPNDRINYRDSPVDRHVEIFVTMRDILFRERDKISRLLQILQTRGIKYNIVGRSSVRREQRSKLGLTKLIIVLSPVLVILADNSRLSKR